MNEFVRYKVILILVLFNYSIAAQDVVINENKLSKKAIEYFYDGDYQSALPYYLQLYELNPQDIIYNFCLGVIYLNVAPNMSKGIDKSKAISHLKFVYNKNKVIETSYYLARAYHLTYRFDKAIKYYKEYEDALERYDPVLLTPLFEEKDEIAAIERQIEMCNNGKLIMQDTIDIKFENLGNIINSPYPDYAPCISADNEVLIFTSRRPFSTGNKKYLDYDYYEDIYISYKINGTWTEAISISENINTKKHDASIGLSPDAQTLFMYYKGDIYMSQLDGDTWNLPEKLGDAINTSAWETHVSMTSAQNTIYFISDRKGGYGGRDIYKARKLSNGEWGMVENLGPKINTPYDEEAPFIHPDEKHLYFSSKGHNSMGGFDIFYSSLKNGEWSEPKNMGYPINTPDDDIYFVVSANGKEGYLSTIRKNSLGDKDIYSALMPDTGEVPLTVIRGMIKDENGKPIYAKFTVIDNETNEIVGYYNTNSATGKYLLVFPPGKNYNIIISADGYAPHSERVYVPDQDRFYDLYQEVQLSSIQTKGAIPGPDSVIGQKVFMRNAFFDIDKAVQITDPVLSKVQVKEIAYSAFLGNLERSDNRDSIIALLDTVAGVGGFIGDYSPTVQIHIIEEPRNKNMEMIVFGQDTIYATSSSSNTNVEFASLDMSVISVQPTYYVTQEELDTAKIHPTLYLSMKGLKEGLEEIVMIAEHIEQLQQDAVSDRDEELTAPMIQVKEEDEGETEEFVKVSEEQVKKPEEIVKELDEFAEDVKPKIREEIIGKPVFLSNIFFDIEKSTLLPASVAELKKVLKIMRENTSLTVEISGHTCSLGEENYNLMLSKARAQAVVDFLTDNGISKTRLHAQGYGESRPVATNETLEGRSKNRRIEIKIR